MLGELVGSYRITGKIAEGGMGVVYRAQHELIGKPAAVKLLLPELSSNHDIVNRFFTEARAATAVRHPGIVEVFDFGYMQNGMAYIVMELLDGEPLSRRLATQGKLEERHALVITRGVASALAAAHSKQIVHRDLKPDNVFLVPDPDMPGGERAKILDFGIAKVSEAQRGTGSKTRTGAVMGTPTYMSPEQCRGAGEVDHRSDLYAIGCILYEMVAGRPPFTAEGVGELIAAHMLIAPEPPTRFNPNLSAGTEGLILNLLAKNPAERVQTAGELARLLGQGSMPSASLSSMSAPTQAMSPLLTPIPTPLPGSRTATGQPGVPTTLSGAAQGSGTLPPPTGKSKVPLFAGIGVVLVGGIAAAVVLAGGGGGSKTTSGNDTGSTGSAGSASGIETASGASSGSVTAEVTPDAGAAAAVMPDAAEAIAATAVDAGVDAAAVATSDKGDKGSRSGSGSHRGDRTGGKTGGKTGGQGKTGGDTGGKTGGGTDATTGSGTASGSGKRVDRGD
ncbi:MAG TPA: serine/threonine-protein kinase [Kofleriaceae bacterium]|nr:serine/threonine-protein kinase [Kofleriaceae bacterium]